METAREHPDLTSELEEWGCPVCNHLVRVTFEFYCQWQYDLATDGAVQQTFAAELGFCPLHTWQLATFASPAGFSRGCPRLLEHLSAELGRLSGAAAATAGDVAALVRRPDGCRVCGLVRTAEQEYLAALGRFLDGDAGRKAYARGQGVCLRHLPALLAALPDTDVVRTGFLLVRAAGLCDRLAQDMRTYAGKLDSLQRSTVTPDEEYAHLRAVIHLAGHQRLSGFSLGEGFA